MRQALSYVWNSPWVKAVVLVAGVPLVLLAIGEILRLTPSAWVPALAAFIFAYLANPIVVWLERHRVRRGFGVVLVYFLFLVLLALASYLLAGILAQLVELAGDLPDLVATSANWIQDTISRFRETVPPSFASTLDQVEEAISSFFINLADVLVNWLQGLVGSGGTLLQAASNVVGGVFPCNHSFDLFISGFPSAGQEHAKSGAGPIQAQCLRNYQPARQCGGRLCQGTSGYRRRRGGFDLYWALHSGSSPIGSARFHRRVVQLSALSGRCDIGGTGSADGAGRRRWQFAQSLNHNRNFPRRQPNRGPAALALDPLAGHFTSPHHHHLGHSGGR